MSRAWIRLNPADNVVVALRPLARGSAVAEAGVSLGNKTGYQHHGAWFARHRKGWNRLDAIADLPQ